MNATSYHKVWLRIVLTATKKFLSKMSCSKAPITGTFVLLTVSKFTNFKCRYFVVLCRKRVRLVTRSFSRPMGTMKKDCGFVPWGAVQIGRKLMRCFWSG
jgi:hypothetical protein